MRTGSDGVARVHQDLQDVGAMGPDGQVRPAQAFPPVPERDFLERVRRAVQAKASP